MSLLDIEIFDQEAHGNSLTACGGDTAQKHTNILERLADILTLRQEENNNSSKKSYSGPSGWSSDPLCIKIYQNMVKEMPGRYEVSLPA